ncbi:MAG: phenylalanine--tRNA ligase subunit beta [Deltaproteobacteria bacterium]|nr:phenylalanine--tRNA ligase subunit beta [Deltaproteobacteria bacterium]
MKASLSWLNEYVPVKMKASDLSDALTMAGLEVEAVSDRYDYLSSVVTGRIVEVHPHPNADRLKLCEVDVGDRVVSVVCGASNVEKDLLVPAALPGTLFPDGSLLKKSEIRGQQSEGMLCSEAELRIAANASGIMVLDGDLSPGLPLNQALGLSDPVFEIDLTPNRSDCLSIIGIAREIAALQNTSIKLPDTDIPETGNKISEFTSVTLKAPDLCPRYSARLIFDITVAPSPFWLQDRLMSVGLKPINNIVDITNFVMMETGQPLHAFDFERLADNKIVVRAANKGENFTTLDRKQHTLSSDMLMICDGEKPVALAGVMGGLNSEIEDTTTKVLIESAYFDPVCIRKTSKKLGLNTESSHRFERGTDPEGTIRAVNRAARLMLEMGGGKLIEGLIDEYPESITKKAIPLSVSDTNRLLGIRLDQDEIDTLLQSIECKVKKKGNDKLEVLPPSFRVDIARPVDLMEEVARLSGYNNIPTTFPLIPAEARKPALQIDSRNRIKDLMTGFGFTEIISYSFINKLSSSLFSVQTDNPEKSLVEILNPLSEDHAVMRTSLIPGLLATMNHNISKQVRNLKIFEIGKTFFSTGTDKQAEETEMLSGLWTGSRFENSWLSKETACDFYDIKGVVEELLRSLGLSGTKFTRMPKASCNYTKPGYTAQIILENDPMDKMIGLVAEVDSRMLENFGLEQTAFIFELNISRLIRLIPTVKTAKPIPKFPATSRDITIIIDKDVEAENILRGVEILNDEEELVENLSLFDIYEGEPVPKTKKSVSFRITYRSSQGTLEDDTVNQIHSNITHRLIKKFDATLPD